MEMYYCDNILILEIDLDKIPAPNDSIDSYFRELE